jgi:hypothetical protein
MLYINQVILQIDYWIDSHFPAHRDSRYCMNTDYQFASVKPRILASLHTP